MKTFKLEILTMERVFFAGTVVSLSLPIDDGMIGVQAGRAPFVASISVGEAHYTTESGQTVRFSISGGMITVENNTATLLCDTALLPEEIDDEKERIELALARSELAKKQSHREYLLSKLMLSNAVNNLRVKRKHINH